MLPENWDAVRAFLAAQTQWRYAGMSGAPLGLDYAGARAAVRATVADGRGLERRGRRLRWRRVFGRLRTMEAAAVDELAKRRDAQAKRST